VGNFGVFLSQIVQIARPIYIWKDLEAPRNFWVLCTARAALIREPYIDLQIGLYFGTSWTHKETDSGWEHILSLALYPLIGLKLPQSWCIRNPLKKK